MNSALLATIVYVTLSPHPALTCISKYEASQTPFSYRLHLISHFKFSDTFHFSFL